MTTLASYRALPASAAIVAAAAAAILLTLYAWELPPFRTSVQTTENAYVRGSVTIIAPKIGGYVSDVLVTDYEQVAAGQALVRLDDHDYQQRVVQARAQLAAQEANLANVTQARKVREAAIGSAAANLSSALAQKSNAAAQLLRTRADERRAEALVVDGSLSARERDQAVALQRSAESSEHQATAAVMQARAGHTAAMEDLRAVHVNRGAVQAAVDAARASLRLAEIDLENTVIRAPRSGSVGEVGVKLGQYVAPGTQLVALVPANMWVIANFKEGQTADMAVGQRAWFEVDALHGARFTGRIERIAPATGSEFTVLRTDTTTGNFTKVAQRLPIRILVDEGQPLAKRLRPGMSVIASVETAASGAR